MIIKEEGLYQFQCGCVYAAEIFHIQESGHPVWKWRLRHSNKKCNKVKIMNLTEYYEPIYGTKKITELDFAIIKLKQ